MKKILILSLLFISGWMSAQAVDLNKENRDPEYVKSIVGRSQKIVDKLGLTDAKIAEDVRNVIANRYFELNDIYEVRDAKVKKVKEWRNVQDELVEVNRKNLKLSNIQEFGINYLTQIKNTIILGLAAFMVIEGSITLGTMLAISFIIGQLNAPLEHFVLFIYSLQDAKISLERLIDVYEKKSMIKK